MTVWGIRDFRLLWAAGTISGLGAYLLLVAAPVHVYLLTGSPTATGLTLVVETLPLLRLGPWAGALVDRLPRRTVLVVADLCAAGGVLLMLPATSEDRVWWVYLGLLVENAAVAFQRPAARAILPTVVGTGPPLAAANAVTAFSTGVLRLVGPPAGTLLLAVGGFPAAVWVDAATYLVSAALTVAIAARAAVTAAPGGVRAGFRCIVRTPVLRGLLVTSWAYWTANAGLTALLVPFVVQRLGAPGGDVGWLVSGLGVGFLAGSAVSRWLLPRSPVSMVITVSYALVGICFVGLFNAGSLLWAAVAAGCAAVPGAVAVIATQHTIQSVTPEGVLGRVGAAFFTGDALAAVTGALAAPAAVAWLGLPGTLNALSVLVLLVAAASPLLLPRAR